MRRAEEAANTIEVGGNFTTNQTEEESSSPRIGSRRRPTIGIIRGNSDEVSNADEEEHIDISPNIIDKTDKGGAV